MPLVSRQTSSGVFSRSEHKKGRKKGKPKISSGKTCNLTDGSGFFFPFSFRQKKNEKWNRNSELARDLNLKEFIFCPPFFGKLCFAKKIAKKKRGLQSRKCQKLPISPPSFPCPRASSQACNLTEMKRKKTAPIHSKI